MQIQVCETWDTNESFLDANLLYFGADAYLERIRK